MERVSREQIVSDLAKLLRNFNGREYTGPITPSTWFFADLGLVSIDAVVLGEQIEELYGSRFPFHEFVADQRRLSSEDIQLGGLVDLVYRHLNSRG